MSAGKTSGKPTQAEVPEALPDGHPVEPSPLDRAGTIAGRAPSAGALGIHADETPDEEPTGSPGADADREQAEEREHKK
jgi:hypothetical protein